MDQKILDFAAEQLKYLGVGFKRNEDELIIGEGTRLESKLYVEEWDQDIATVGVIFEHKVHYAIIIKYNKGEKKVTKFRAVVPNISTFEGKTVESLFIKLLSIFVRICEKMLKSDRNPNMGTLE